MNRELVYQAGLFLLLAVLLFTIFSSTQSNLARLGVETDLDFFWKRAGFEIGQSLVEYDANSTIARAFLVALLNTLLLAACSIVCASVLGLIIGVSRLSSNWLVSRLALVYIEIFRNIPALLQVFFWYFVVLRSLPRSRDSLVILDMAFLNNRGLFFPAPASGADVSLAVLALFLTTVIVLWARVLNSRNRWQSSYLGSWVPAGVAILLFACALLLIDWDYPALSRFGYHGGYVLMPEFIALVIGLSMYNATYIGEIVRSSFSAVSPGQTEAARALGMTEMQCLRLVVFPQALRVMIPPLITVYLNLFKSTSLAAAVAYPELVSVFVGTVNNLVGQPVLIMSLTLAVYATVSLCIAMLLNWYNRRISLVRGVVS